MHLPQKSLEQLVREHDVLSLDVFDTAVFRRVERPVDVFRVVEANHRRKHPQATAFEFASERIQAELRAREVHAGRDVTFGEIYAQLPARDGWDPSELMAMELAAEEALATPNPAIMAVYRYARILGRRIVFVSDMYLPEGTIRRILESAGYDEFEALFVSSAAEGKTKGDGRLFSVVAGALGVATGRVVHVGDNAHSDVTMAVAAGMSARHYAEGDRSAQSGNLTAAESEGGAVARGIQALHAKAVARENVWQRFGFQACGPLYAGFAAWLADRVQALGVEHVYFLARDGFVLQKAYELFRTGGSSLPASSYLYVSRRALNVPAIEVVDDHALSFLSSYTDGLTVADCLERCGLEIDTVGIRAAGFRGPAHTIVSDDDRHRLRTLFQSQSEAVLAVAREERAVLLRYLAHVGLTERKRVAVVDLGWHGSLQRSLMVLLRGSGIATEVHGFYLGLFRSAPIPEADKRFMHGWLFDWNGPDAREEVVRYSCEICEFAHVAPHGSVVRMSECDGSFAPVFASDDSDSRKLDWARDVQRSGLRFVEEFARVATMTGGVSLAPKDAISGFERVARSPTAEEAQCFGEIQHAAGFGSAFRTRPLARPPWKKEIVANPNALFDGFFDRAYWKRGYVARALGRFAGPQTIEWGTRALLAIARRR